MSIPDTCNLDVLDVLGQLGNITLYVRCPGNINWHKRDFRIFGNIVKEYFQICVLRFRNMVEF